MSEKTHKAQLILYGSDREGEPVEFSDSLSLGRSADNRCSVENKCLSRRHAVIERSGDRFVVRDLGSSNGTTVNGRQITSVSLADGDELVFGGSIRARFSVSTVSNHESRRDERADTGRLNRNDRSDYHDGREGRYPPGLSSSSNGGEGDLGNNPPMSMMAAAVCLGLLLTGGSAFAVKPVMNSITRNPAVVKLANPSPGSTLRGRIPLQIEVPSARRIRKVGFQLDGEEIAAAQVFPFTTYLDVEKLDPKYFETNEPHFLAAGIEFADGTVQFSQSVLVQFARNKRRESTKSSPTAAPGSQPPGNTSMLVQTFTAQLTGKSRSVFDPALIALIETEIQGSGNRPTAIDRSWQRIVAKAFRDRGISPLLGTVIAFSRQTPDASGIGPWKLPPEIVGQYLRSNETDFGNLSPERTAEIAADYMHDLLVLFDSDDMVFALACFGKSLSEAAQVRMKLESADPDRRMRADFWKFVGSGVIDNAGAGAVSRFYAAGLVSEYPQYFGRANEPLSSKF